MQPRMTMDAPMDTRLQREALEQAIAEVETYQALAKSEAEAARQKNKIARQCTEMAKAMGHADALAVLHRIANDMLRAEIESKRAYNKMLAASQ